MTTLITNNAQATPAHKEVPLTMTHEAVTIVDTEQRITFWNRAAEELYGWKAEEVLGRTSQQILGYPLPVGPLLMEAGDIEQPAASI